MTTNAWYRLASPMPELWRRREVGREGVSTGEVRLWVVI